MPLADVQLRRKPSYAQRGIASQTCRSTARDRVRPALAQVSKQKTLDPREPRGAVRSFHQHFFQQGHVARLEKITQVDLFIYEVLHPLAHQASGGLRLEADEENAERTAWSERHDACPDRGPHVLIPPVPITPRTEISIRPHRHAIFRHETECAAA